MANHDVAALLRDTMLLTAKLGGPPLLATLAVGLLVSLLQAVTQINEATLSFLPKALVLCAVLAVTGSWMAGSLLDFAHLLFDRVVAVGGS